MSARPTAASGHLRYESKKECCFQTDGKLKGRVVKRYLKAVTNSASELTLSLTLVPLKTAGLFKCWFSQLMNCLIGLKPIG